MKQITILKEQIGKVTSGADIFNKIKKINIDYAQENFIVFYLDNKNKVINNDVLFKGGLSECLIDPKTLFRNALKNNTSAIIISHNHPSGNLEPSTEDISVFEMLKKGGEILGVRVLDSIIFNEKEFYGGWN